MQETVSADSKKRFLSEHDKRLGFEKKRKLQCLQNSSNQSTEAQLSCANNIESQPEETWLMMIEQFLSETIDNFERMETSEIDSSTFAELHEAPVAMSDHQTVMLRLQESSNNDPLSGLSNEDFCLLCKMLPEDDSYERPIGDGLGITSSSVDWETTECNEHFCLLCKMLPEDDSYERPIGDGLGITSSSVDWETTECNEDFCLLCKMLPEDDSYERPIGDGLGITSSSVDWETTECTEEMLSELTQLLVKEYRIIPGDTDGETGESMNSAVELEMIEQVIGSQVIEVLKQFLLEENQQQGE